jgi:hypothetical protein
VFDELTAELETQLTAMEATDKEELTALNQALEDRGLEPVGAGG